MKDKDQSEQNLKKIIQEDWAARIGSGLFSAAEEIKYLDTAQLATLEKSFREWAEDAAREDVRISRKRIMLIFLLIRYTGARLGEVLRLNERERIDTENLIVRLGGEENAKDSALREVEIPAELGREVCEILNDPKFSAVRGELFNIDPAHVRRKFYECAEACGFSKELGNPSAIRRSRAIELLRNNLPLPIVQKILGHSTPNLATAYIDFSSEDMKKLVRHFIDKESRRKTSARNSFYGKISHIRKGDIQTEVRITTLSGYSVTAIITNESLERLRLNENSFLTAEIKAPWIIVSVDKSEPQNSASNKFQGRVAKIIQGAITTEYTVTLDDGTDICALVTEESRKKLALKEGDRAWVVFSALSVILNVD
jgi:molybdate transport system regulatory protein